MEKLNTSLYNRSEELHWLKNLKGEMYEEDYILKTYPALFADFWGTPICCLYLSDILSVV